MDFQRSLFRSRETGSRYVSWSGLLISLPRVRSGH